MITVAVFFVEAIMRLFMFPLILTVLLLIPGCSSKRPFILHTFPVEGHEYLFDDRDLDECMADNSLPSITEEIVFYDEDEMRSYGYEEQYEEYVEETYDVA